MGEILPPMGLRLMIDLSYFVSRGLKKLRGSAVKACTIHKTSKIESDCTVIDTVFARHSFCGYGKGFGS